MALYKSFNTLCFGPSKPPPPLYITYFPSRRITTTKRSHILHLSPYSRFFAVVRIGPTPSDPLLNTIYIGRTQPAKLRKKSIEKDRWESAIIAALVEGGIMVMPVQTIAEKVLHSFLIFSIFTKMSSSFSK